MRRVFHTEHPSVESSFFSWAAHLQKTVETFWVIARAACLQVWSICPLSAVCPILVVSAGQVCRAVFEVAYVFAGLGQCIHKSTVREAHSDASLKNVSHTRHVLIRQ